MKQLRSKLTLAAVVGLAVTVVVVDRVTQQAVSAAVAAWPRCPRPDPNQGRGAVVMLDRFMRVD